MQNDLRMGKATLYRPGPAGNDIRAIYVGGQSVWMGGINSGERQGFTRASTYLDEWSGVERRDDSRIRSTELWDVTEWKNEIWFATNDGLLSFDEKKGRWSRTDVSDNLYASEIRALLSTDSVLWVGTVRGLCYVSPSGEIYRIQNPGIELSGVTDLAALGDTLYVATPNGLFKGSTKSREFSFTNLDPGMLNAPVLELSVASGELWLATSDGVARYNSSTATSKSWLTTDFLKGARPSCVLATETHAWVGTESSGFFRYRKDTGEWIRYTTEDGLLDNHIQVIRQSGDDLLIGTPTGLTRFYWNRPGRAR
jgi:ligand-binding sensor domain-containing protein